MTGMREDVDAKPTEGDVTARPASWEPRSDADPPQAAFAITVAFELHECAFVEFHRLVTENAAASVSLEPDCIRFDVLTPVPGEPGPDVLLYEVYKSKAAFDLHLASEHFLSFDRRTRHLVRTKTVLAFTALENAKPGIVRD